MLKKSQLYLFPNLSLLTELTTRLYNLTKYYVNKC